MDLSKLSDDELDALHQTTLAGAKQAPKKPNPADLSSLSDEELDALEQEHAEGFGDKALKVGQKVLNDYVVPAGRYIDTYTGAPSRAAIGAAQEAENPIAAFVKQMGKNPDLAPSGRKLAQRAGVSDTALSDVLPDMFNESGQGWRLQRGGWADPTASGTAGFGLDVASDWSNIVPVSAAAKVIGKGGAKTAAVAVKSAAKVADFATGTKVASKTLEAGKDVAGSIARAVGNVASPKRVSNWDEIAASAQRNGIDPAQLSANLEFGPSSFIARGQRFVNEGPAGEAALLGHNAGAKSISDALERKMEVIGPGGRMDPAQAGSALREGLHESEAKLFGSLDMSHQQVQKYAPGLRVDREEMAAVASKLAGIEKYASGLTKRGIDTADRVQGRYLLNAVNQFRNGNGTYKQMHEALQSIGRKAFGKPIQGQIPHDVERLRDLYFTVNDALLGTVKKHVNPEFADEIIKNNGLVSAHLKRKTLLQDAGKATVADEHVFSRLLGDTNKIEAVKQSVSPETFQKMKGAYLNQAIRSGADGAVNFRQLQSSIAKDPEIWKALYSPEELSGIQEIIKLGVEHGPAVLSSSGTGASIGFRKLIDGIVSGSMMQKQLDLMKSSARGAGGPVAAKAAKLLNESGAVDPEMLKYYGKRMMGARDSRPSQALKAAQALSVKDDPKSAWRRVPGNPGLLEYVNDQSVRRTLERAAKK